MSRTLVRSVAPRRRSIAALSALLSVLAGTIVIKAQRSGTDTYAIVNARIVTVSGPVIEKGSVVLRDGLIAAVGVNVVPPADARVIDGNGLTVYPGLIDANTNLGIPEPSPLPTVSPTPAAPAGPPVLRSLVPLASVPNSTQPAGLQPELKAEDLLRPGGEQIDSARSAGITSALTSPRGGIWIGQSALINLAGDTPQQMLLRSPVALHIGFTPLRGVYPGSLMGVFASLRQMLLDAQRYRDARIIYERSPRGIKRPMPDRSLEALLPALDGTMLVVMYADREREIRRALDLAEEFKLKVIIAGGSEAWKVPDRLRKNDVAVLLSLNFPRRTTTAMPEADQEPLRVLRERVETPRTAAKLAAANVRFAFQSGAMPNIADFLTNAAKAVENGLSKDEALRALTIRPAEIFSVGDRLGSIEAGKIANLILTRGDLFDSHSRITYVFIDGRPIDLRPTPAATVRNAAMGTWALNVDLGQGPVAITLNLQQEGERVRGSIQGALGVREIANGAVGPTGEIRFTSTVTLEGQTTEANFVGTISGDQMKGTVNITGRAPGSFTATRSHSVSPPETFSPLARQSRDVVARLEISGRVTSGRERSN